MKLNYYFLFISLFIFQFSCTSEGGEEMEDTLVTKSNINNIDLIDFGNNDNGSDLIVLLNNKIDATVDEIQLFVTRPNDVIDKGAIRALNNGNSISVPANQMEHEIKFNANISDLMGAPISNNIDYILRVAYKSANDVFIDSQTNEFRLSNEFYLNGRFTGTWTDNVFTGGVSADLQLLAGKLRGKFWFQNNYTSCCDGPDADDGTLSIELDDLTITKMNLSQLVDNYNGGPCNGSYEGSGAIERFNTLVIDFTGDDCDGFHDGTFRITKDPDQ